MKINFLLSALALWASGQWIAALHGEEAATVLENRVNVRGQPTLSSEVITQLKEGDTVTILEELLPDKPKAGEPSKWARIAMPVSVNVWVHSRFIDEPSKTVLPRRLNVRTGPGENFSIVGRLAQGDEIGEVSRKDGWVEIRPPTNAYAFVAVELLKRTRTPAETVQSLATVPSSTIPETTTATGAPLALKPPPEGAAPIATTASTDSTPEPVVIEDPSRTTARTTSTVTTTPFTTANQEAPRVVEETRPIIQVRDENPSDLNISQTEAARLFFAPDQTQPSSISTETRLAAAEPQAVSSGDLLITAPTETRTVPSETLMAPSHGATTKRLVRREGIISRTASVQAPTHYELESLENSSVINYLYPTTENLSLRGLVGKKVFVTGEEVVDKRWPHTPVLEVATIELLP